MTSSLLRKLNALNAQTAVKPQSDKQLVRRVWSCPFDGSAAALSHTALRRMSYNGHSFDINRALFIDTETTGLSGGAGTVAFLVGVGYVSGGEFRVEQFLMPDYSFEPDLLNALAELFPKFDSVVHYNGKSFDMPLLKSRFIMNRMQSLWREFDQLDLLTPTRRLWKLRLRDCRLSNIESEILGIQRDGDIPGSEIPERYFAFLKSGDISSLEDIISHNRQDIFTLLTLLLRLNAAYAEPENVGSALDSFSLGKALERQGETEQARKLYKIAAIPAPVNGLDGLIQRKYAGFANMRLFHIYRRAGDYASCEEVLLRMLKRGQMATAAKLELAKLYEHRLHKFDAALSITRELMKECSQTELPALKKREERLISKINKQTDGG